MSDNDKKSTFIKKREKKRDRKTDFYTNERKNRQTFLILVKTLYFFFFVEIDKKILPKNFLLVIFNIVS